MLRTMFCSVAVSASKSSSMVVGCKGSAIGGAASRRGKRTRNEITPFVNPLPPDSLMHRRMLSTTLWSASPSVPSLLPMCALDVRHSLARGGSSAGVKTTT